MSLHVIHIFNSLFSGNEISLETLSRPHKFSPCFTAPTNRLVFSFIRETFSYIRVGKYKLTFNGFSIAYRNHASTGNHSNEFKIIDECSLYYTISTSVRNTSFVYHGRANCTGDKYPLSTYQHFLLVYKHGGRILDSISLKNQKHNDVYLCDCCKG